MKDKFLDRVKKVFGPPIAYYDDYVIVNHKKIENDIVFTRPIVVTYNDEVFRVSSTGCHTHGSVVDLQQKWDESPSHYMPEDEFYEELDNYEG